jgi:hypothetical protein
MTISPLLEILGWCETALLGVEAGTRLYQTRKLTSKTSPLRPRGATDAACWGGGGGHDRFQSTIPDLRVAEKSQIRPPRVSLFSVIILIMGECILLRTYHE